MGKIKAIISGIVMVIVLIASIIALVFDNFINIKDATNDNITLIRDVEQELIDDSEADINLEDDNEIIGTLTIPKVELSAPIKEGIDQGILAEYIGHFSNSAVWEGNVCLAAHNRGDSVKHYFDRINELVSGDTIKYTTKLGERNYNVVEVKTIENTEWSITESNTNEKNTITLITCITNHPEKRLCVVAEEKN